MMGHFEFPEIASISLLVLMIIVAAAFYCRLAQLVLQKTADNKALHLAAADLRSALDMLFEHSLLGLIRLDQDGTVVQVNRRECEFRDLRADQITGKKYWELAPAAQRDNVRSGFQRLIVGDVEVQPYRQQFQHPGGRRVAVETKERCLRDAQGQVRGVWAFSQDASDTILAEEESARKAQMVQALFSAMPDAFFHLDPAGAVLDYKPAPHFALAPELVVGRWLRDVLPVQAQQPFEEVLLVSTRMHTEMTAEFSAGDGEQLRHFELRLIPFCFNETAVVLRDVTPRKEAERRLQQSASQLQRKNAELAEALSIANAAHRSNTSLLATLSQQFRTPLQGILGLGSMALEGELDAEPRQHLEMIQQSARSMLEALTGMLCRVELEAGSLRLEYRRMVPGEVVEAAVAPHRRLAQAKGIQLAVCAAPEANRPVWGDAGRLRQAISGLVEDAVQHTLRGGVELEMVLEVADGGTCTLGFTISDTRNLGAEAQSATSADGLGVGLAGSLIELAGGHLEIANTPGAGTRYHFSVVLDAEAKTGTAISDASLASWSLRVALATGGGPESARLRRQLEAWGCTCTEVGQMRDVLVHLRRAFHDGAPCHVVLASIEKPGGGDAAWLEAAVKADPKLHNTILVGIAAQPLASDEAARLLRGGWGGIVPMPVEPAELYRTLQLALAGGPCEEQPPHTDAAGAKAGRKALVVEESAATQKSLLRMLAQLGYAADAVSDGRRVAEAIRGQSYDVVLLGPESSTKLAGRDSAADVRRLQGPHGRTPVVAVTGNSFSGDLQSCIDAGLDGHVALPLDVSTLRHVLASIES